LAAGNDRTFSAATLRLDAVTRAETITITNDRELY
jgi:hypothetical protein